MKKYLIYMRRLCALLLVLALVVSQDIIPVHALTDEVPAESAAVEAPTENGSGDSEDSSNKDGGKDTVIETPEENGSGGSEDGGNKDGSNEDGSNEDGSNKGGSEDTTPETPSEDEGVLSDSDILQDDKILPEEGEDTSETYTISSAYDENGIHVNPTTKEKTDPLGSSVTVKPGNNESGAGSLQEPYYSLGKAYASTDGKADRKIYVHNGVIISGSGTAEDGSTFVTESGDIDTAVYFKEDKKLTVLQADNLDALFTVVGGSLTLQNMSMGIVDNSALTDAQLRVALSGGKVILGDNLTVPENRFYFHVTETIGGTTDETAEKAPIQVNSLPITSEGDPIPVLVSADLVDKYVKYTKTPDDATKTTTEEWKVKIPIAQIADSVDLSKVVLKGIGSMGTMTYGAFTKDSYSEEVTGETEQLKTTEWNTPLAFTQEDDNTVYLTGYHKTVIQEKTNTSYQGLIYVGLDRNKEWGKDTNDGLTIDTPVKTLKKAKDLLDYYDSLYKDDYNYPKIYINGCLNITDDQSLDFRGYETTEDAAFAPSNTGYRASLWYGNIWYQYYTDRGVIHVGNGGRLYLGQGVNIRDLEIEDSAINPDTLKNKKPEDVTGSKRNEDNYFIRCDSECNIILENMKYESVTGVLIYLEDTPSATSVTVKNCNITAQNLLKESRSNGTLNLQIEGASAITCKKDVLVFGSYTYTDVNGESVRIALDDNASWNSVTKKPEGKGYLYSESGAIIRNEQCNRASRKGEVQIESGLLAGNGPALMDLNSGKNQLSIYMKADSKYYQANKDGSIIRIRDSDQSRVYYQGGEIQSQGKAFLNTVKEGGLDYRLILDGGLPVTGNNEPLKILAEKQWVMPHIYLGAGKENVYNKEVYASKIEMDLYNADRDTPFSDMSKLVGKMDPADNLETVKSMFKLLYDGEAQIYDGKTIITSQGGTYLILGVNGIYIDGTEYDPETGFGGRSYGTIIDSTHADGSMVNPVRTFWDAQLVYDKMPPEARKKLKGIYILNRVTIENGDNITVAGTGGEVSSVTESEIIPGTYTCNFGGLTIYDSTNSPTSNVRSSKMLYVQKGSLTLDHAVLDGSLISEDDTAWRTMISVDQSGTLNISNTTIQNMNYAVDKGAIYVNGGTLKVDNESKIIDTNSKHAIYCTGNTTCEINDSVIRSTGRCQYSDEAVIYNGSIGTFTLNGSKVLSELTKNGLMCEAYAVCKIVDSEVESKYGDAAIYVKNGDGYSNYPGGKMDISGSKTKITGKRAIYYLESEFSYTYRFDAWNLNISKMAELVSTSGNALDFYCKNARLMATISGAKITASGGSDIHYNAEDKSITDQIILNAAPGDSVELNASSYYGVQVDTTSKSRKLIVGLGGEVRTNVRDEDFNFGNSNAEIVLKNELTGNSTYLVKIMEQYIGKTLVDCSEVASDAAYNQSHFTLCEDSVELYRNLGIQLYQSGSEYNPAVKDTKHLWIPVSETIFWDWSNGDDRNAEQENGGHCPELPVKSVNGIRRVLLKDGKLKIVENQLKVTDSFTTPVKVAAMSTMYFNSYSDNADKYVNLKCYGDDFRSGRYEQSSAENPANLFNWVMPEPTNDQQYLIDIVKVKYNSDIRKSNLGNIFSLYHSQAITFKIENVRFSGIKAMNQYHDRIEIGKNVQLVMNNCYVDCSNDEQIYGASYPVINISGSGRNSQISNVTITGRVGYGITVAESNKSGLLLDHVNIPVGEDYALSLSGSAAMVTIRGEDSFLRTCKVSNGGCLIAEEGTIIGHNNYSGTYSAVNVDKGEFYLRGTAKVEGKEGDGVYIRSGGKAYLEGGEIIGDTSLKQSAVGILNQGTTELSGTTVKGCYQGVLLDDGNITMTGGSITNNTYGVYGNYRIATMTLSGGSIRGNTYAGIIGGSRMTFIMNGGEICNNGMLEKTGDNNYGKDCGGIVGCKDVTITGGRISGNRGYYGGGIMNCIGTVQISGGVIEENEGATAGGGIYQETGTVRVEGGTIRNNRAPQGSAVYVTGDSLLELNGGEITGNKNTDTGKNTGEIYIAGSKDMKIGKKGLAYPKVDDTIYLNSEAGKIQLAAAVRGDYNIRVNENVFHKGDIVVLPNGDSVLSAASYLTHFTLLSDAHVLARKGINLVLDGIVFVNGMADTNKDGTLPNLPRNDFAELIKDAKYNDNVIYVTGAIHIKNGEHVTVTDRTIRRYTGQPINGTNYDAYIYNEPLFIVDKGGTLTLINTTVSGRMGVKSDETYNTDTGYLIENYGTLNIDVNSDTIASGTDKDNHSVLTDNLSSGLGIAQHGTMNMSVFSQVDQMIKLGGKDVEDTAVYYGDCAVKHNPNKKQSCTDTVDRMIQIYGDTAGSGLQKTLHLDVDHKADQRKVTTYKALKKSTDLQIEKALHQIKDLKTSGYYLVSQIPDGNTGAAPDLQQVDMILRKPGIYYVDGVNGNDNSNKGTCPDQAFKTLEHAYERLAADAANSQIETRGGLIYIVNCVTLTNGLTISQKGEASVLSIGGKAYDTKGDVTIRRYSKPDTTDLGYTASSNQGNMFAVAQDTTVSMQGITIDGHSQKLESGDEHLAAEGVTNADAVFEVSGTLNLGSATATHDTLVQNNDASGKNGGLIRVMGGGSLHVSGDAPKAADLAEGQTAVYGTRLSGGKADKGSAIYAGQGTSGAVTLAKGTSDYPKVDGSIYLTGNGQVVNSSYLTIADGTPGAITDSRYDLELQDAYNGRLVVSYPVGTTLSAADGKGYAVSGRQGYDVTVNDADKSQIILKSLGAVYIDGVGGADANDGITPKTAVKTLKRAYDLLQTQKGGMLYVVNTVTITDAQKLTEKSYTNYGTNVDLDEGTVQIQRYGKPTAYGTTDWPDDDPSKDNFNVESNVNALFCVSGNGTLDLQNILIDGHKDAVALTDALSYRVNTGAIEATAPLIQVAGGRLNLGEGAVLQNNNNVTAPADVNIEAGKLQGGAVYNTGTVNVTGGTVKGNSWTGTEKTYQISTAETVKVTPNASGIWQAGTMTVNVNDASAINWADDQYIYLDEQAYNPSVTEQEAKDAKVSFLNVQSLPADVVLPLDLNRRGADDGKATGWFAPGRKIVEMNTAETVTAANFTVNSGSYVGCWLEGSAAVTEKLTLAEREGNATILELQRAASDCIIDAIVPVKAPAGTNSIHNLSEKAIIASGAVDKTEISARRKNDNVTITGELSDTNRIKLTCSDGK